MFVLDFLIIVVFNGFPFALSNSAVDSALAGYWALMALNEGLYSIWDLALLFRVEGPSARQFFTRWSIASVIAVLLYAGTSMTILVYRLEWFSVGLVVVSASYVATMLLMWNIGRYKKNKAEGLGFLAS
jgi:hypothetical protein